MPAPSNTLDCKVLRRIRSLELFSDEQLKQLFDKLHISHARPNERICQLAETGDVCLYIISGEAISRDRDGSVKLVETSIDGFLQPVARIRPSLYDIDAVSTLVYLKIANELLTEFSLLIEPELPAIEVQYIDQGDELNQLTMQFCIDISQGNISLPTMPDIVYKIQRAFADENSSTTLISELIQSDPVISARVLRTANSVIYHRGSKPIDSLNQAIVRLGMKVVRQQVIIYAASELFKGNSPAIKNRMQNLWKASRRVAAFSRILALRTTSFDAEQAQIAGLLSDLGEIAILNYMQTHEHLYQHEESLENTLRVLRPQINGMLLQKWNLGDDLITVGEESHNWFRNHTDNADLCDLVLIARYHSYMGSEKMHRLPVLAKMPAFFKLNLGFDPRDSLEFLKQSQVEVSAIEQMLGACRT